MSKVTPNREHAQTLSHPTDPGRPYAAEVGVNGPRSGSRSDAVGAVEAGLGGCDDPATVGSAEPGYALAAAYAQRSGRLMAAVEMLLAVVEGYPEAQHRASVRTARGILAEVRSPLVTR